MPNITKVPQSQTLRHGVLYSPIFDFDKAKLQLNSVNDPNRNVCIWVLEEN